jgi:hypothetical protein
MDGRLPLNQSGAPHIDIHAELTSTDRSWIMTMGWHMMLWLVNGFFVISDAGGARLAERE